MKGKFSFWTICRLKRFSLVGFFLPLIIKALFEVAYANSFSVLFGYLGDKYNPSLLKFWVSWGAAIVFSFLSISLSKKSFISKLFNFFLYLSIVPSLSVFWLKDESQVAFILIIVYWLIWWFCSYLVVLFESNNSFSRTNHVISLSNENNPFASLFIVIVFLFVAGMVLFFSAKYGNYRLFIRLDDVYDYRLSDENTMSAIESYIFAFITNIILPLFLCIHFLKKRFIYFIFDTFLLLLCYGIYGNKSMLFTIPLIIGFVLLSKMNLLKEVDTLLGFFLIAYLALCINPSNVWISALGDRLITIPAIGHYNYYDFFSQPEHPLLFLRESIMRVVSVSPYETAVSKIIGSSPVYYSGKYNNMNNGLFSAAYANFGYLGVFIQPPVIVFTFAYYIKKLSWYDDLITITFISLSVLFLLSTAFTTWLLTGGLVLNLVLLVLFRRLKTLDLISSSLDVLS